jgi:hypothetical protein
MAAEAQPTFMMRPTHPVWRDDVGHRDLATSGTSRLHSQDCAARRHLDCCNASAIEHHEPVAMPGAKHASVSPKRFHDPMDYLVVITLVVLITDV